MNFLNQTSLPHYCHYLTGDTVLLDMLNNKVRESKYFRFTINNVIQIGDQRKCIGY